MYALFTYIVKQKRFYLTNSVPTVTSRLPEGDVFHIIDLLPQLVMDLDVKFGTFLLNNALNCRRVKSQECRGNPLRPRRSRKAIVGRTACKEGKKQAGTLETVLSHTTDVLALCHCDFLQEAATATATQ